MYGFIHVRIKHKLPKPKERPDSFWLYSWGAFGSYVNTVNAFAGYKAIEYLNADNWKENTGEVDHWKVQHYRDEFGFLQFIKEEDSRDDYYIDTKDGEFKILEADEKSYEDMISEVWLQNGLEMPYYQRYILEFERIINTMTTPTIDDKLKRNLGLYGIVASNGLFNGDNLNEDDFNAFADNMPYFEGLVSSKI